MMWTRLYCLIIITFSFGSLVAQDVRNINLANAYYKSGEVEKARDLFEELANDQRNFPFIYTNYGDLLIAKGEYKKAEKLFESIIKAFPENINFRVDYIAFLSDQDRVADSDRQFAQLSNQIVNNRSLVRSAAQQFVSKQKSGFARKMYEAARSASNNNQAYALELASLFRFLNDKENMIEEYLTFLNSSPNNARYVKNMLQNSLKEDEDFQYLEKNLLAKIQNDAGNMIYPELLVWTYLQQQNFYAAFLQARALDRRQNTDGLNSLEIGEIALENKDYQNAMRIFEYVVKNYPQSITYIKAKTSLVQAKGEVYKNTYPIDTVGIRNLTENYEKLIEQVGLNRTTLAAQREWALLHAFYLDELERATSLLEMVIAHPASSNDLRAKAKLDLGDIYILKEEAWESALLYAQVDKENKNELIGYQAKLKNAKLSYYRGDFDLATDRLDILKLASDREIANDAIELSTMIKKNIAYDTSRQALKELAAIELMLYQNKKAEAMHRLDMMRMKYGYSEMTAEEKFTYGFNENDKIAENYVEEMTQKHQIIDDVIWLQAKINQENGFFEEAINLYEMIYEEYPNSIHADDAFYQTARIFEDGLSDQETAMQYYQQFLKDYPGSFYAADARLRFRKLRGDFME